MFLTKTYSVGFVYVCLNLPFFPPTAQIKKKRRMCTNPNEYILSVLTQSWYLPLTLTEVNFIKQSHCFQNCKYLFLTLTKVRLLPKPINRTRNVSMRRVKLFKSLCPCTQILWLTIPDNFTNYHYAVLGLGGKEAEPEFGTLSGRGNISRM